MVRRGVVLHTESAKTYRCTIVDISGGGARLQLIAPGLPDTGLTLIDAVEARAHEIRVAWRKGPFMGVAFLSSADLPG